MFSAAGVAEVLHHGVIDSIGSSLGYIGLGLSETIVFPFVWAWVGDRWRSLTFTFSELSALDAKISVAINHEVLRCHQPP